MLLSLYIINFYFLSPRKIYCAKDSRLRNVQCLAQLPQPTSNCNFQLWKIIRQHRGSLAPCPGSQDPQEPSIPRQRHHRLRYQSFRVESRVKNFKLRSSLSCAPLGGWGHFSTPNLSGGGSLGRRWRSLVEGGARIGEIEPYTKGYSPRVLRAGHHRT